MAYLKTAAIVAAALVLVIWLQDFAGSSTFFRDTLDLQSGEVAMALLALAVLFFS